MGPMWKLMRGDGESMWRQVHRELRAGNMVTVRTATGAPTLIPVDDKVVRIVHGPVDPRGRCVATPKR